MPRRVFGTHKPSSADSSSGKTASPPTNTPTAWNSSSKPSTPPGQSHPTRPEHRQAGRRHGLGTSPVTRAEPTPMV
jgi:hypothetical protein